MSTSIMIVTVMAFVLIAGIVSYLVVSSTIKGERYLNLVLICVAAGVIIACSYFFCSLLEIKSADAVISVASIGVTAFMIVLLFRNP